MNLFDRANYAKKVPMKAKNTNIWYYNFTIITFGGTKGTKKYYRRYKYAECLTSCNICPSEIELKI